MSNQLGIPPPECLASVGEPPFCFVTDAAFPLKPNVMRPYPSKNVTEEQRIFNYDCLEPEEYRESSGYDGLDLRCFEVTNAPHKNVKNDVE